MKRKHQCDFDQEIIVAAQATEFIKRQWSKQQ